MYLCWTVSWGSPDYGETFKAVLTRAQTDSTWCLTLVLFFMWSYDVCQRDAVARVCGYCRTAWDLYIPLDEAALCNRGFLSEPFLRPVLLCHCLVSLTLIKLYFFFFPRPLQTPLQPSLYLGCNNFDLSQNLIFDYGTEDQSSVRFLTLSICWLLPHICIRVCIDQNLWFSHLFQGFLGVLPNFPLALAPLWSRDVLNSAARPLLNVF